MQAESIRAARGASLLNHTHANLHLLVVLAGSFCEDGRRHIAGDVRVSPAGYQHFLCFTRDSRCLLLQIEFASAWPTCIERWSVRAPHLRVLAARAAEAIGGQRHSRDAATDFAWRYVVQLQDFWAQCPSPPAWLLELRRCVVENPAAAPSISHLARAAGVSREHLSRTFQRHYRTSISAFVRYRRMVNACQRITTTSWPLAEIAYASGFSDQSHMTRLLAACFHITPGMLRMEHTPRISQRFKTETTPSAISSVAC